MGDKVRKRLSVAEWLGFRDNLDLAEIRWLGAIFGVLLFILTIILLISVVVTLFDFTQAVFRTGPYTNDIEGAAIRNIGLVLAAILGAPLILWRSIVAARHVQIADEALFNDKINAAAQSLSARRENTRVVRQDGNEVVLKEREDDLVARAAAIDRLEGLVNENHAVAPRVVKLLAIYVRGNFPCINLDITEPPFMRRTPRMDLQRAIDAIGRIYRIAALVDQSHWRLDLKECNLDGVSFQGGYFRAVDFSGSRLEASNFSFGNFEGCWFRKCLLNFGDFRRSNLTGAKFDRAIINRPIPVAGGAVWSINLGEFPGATFIAADISAIDFLGNAEEISKTFGTKDTKISSRLRSNMLPSHEHSRAHTLRELRDSADLSEDDRERIEKLEQTGFQRWSPYDSEDLATGGLLENFYEELEMKKWPFVG